MSGDWRIHRDGHGYYVLNARGEKLCTVNPRLEPRRQLVIAEFVIAAREGLLEYFQAEPAKMEEAARRIAQMDGP